MLIHRVALELAHSACPAEADVDQALKCIQIEPNGRVTACDGQHLVRIRAAADQPDLFVDDLPELGIALDGPVLIPADVAAAFNRGCKRKRKKGQPDVIVVAADDVDGPATLATADGATKRRFIVKPQGGRFPSLASIERMARGAGGPRVEVTLSLDLLRAFVKTLKGCKASTVTLAIHDSSTPIAFRASALLEEHQEPVEIDGVLMPMRDPDTPKKGQAS